MVDQWAVPMAKIQAAEKGKLLELMWVARTEIELVALMAEELVVQMAAWMEYW